MDNLEVVGVTDRLGITVHPPVDVTREAKKHQLR